ncbi:serine hydrolase [Sorangium sp. So ce216]
MLAACDSATDSELTSFITNLDNAMAAQGTTGWSIVVSRRLRPWQRCVKTRSGGFARSALDAYSPFEPTTPTSVVSVSKVIPATALLDVLATRGIPRTAKIGPYLPPGWTLGAGVSDITFEELLQHRSGLQVGGSLSTSAIQSMLEGSLDLISDDS